MLLIAATGASPPARAEAWLPISADELQMTSEPKAPLAPAICLYRQVDRNDDQYREHVYLRFKILADAGRAVASAAIPYDDNVESIRDIQARTIRPDGTIVNFNGQVFDTPIAKSSTADQRAKTFALPDAEVGSIIEYQFERLTNYDRLYNSHWILSLDLFTKDARFSLIPNPHHTVKYSWPLGLPLGTEPPHLEAPKIVMESHDIPAFVTEEHMPPENELRYRVDFNYVGGHYEQMDPDAFWIFYGKVESRRIERFVDRTGAMKKVVRQIVAPEDSADTKLRKIYARVQQLRNLSYERRKSEQEMQRENISRPIDVADIWDKGYSTAGDLSWLLLALARAAGFDADPVLASGRNDYFFNKNIINPAELNDALVVIQLDGRDLFLDPGIPYAPFGQLPWYETAVKAIRLNNDGGHWIDTPLPRPADATVERRGELQLDSSGTLHGGLTITYSGMEATRLRVAERNEDEAARRKFLEDDLKAAIPVASEVTLTNSPAWERADTTLVAEFNLTIPEWAETAGQRMLLPVGVLSAEERHTFEHAVRVQPVYFEYPFQRVDDISIALPPNVRADTVPEARHIDAGQLAYQMTATPSPGLVHLRRELTVNLLLVKTAAYDSLRSFYQSVRAGDEQQIVLLTAAGTGGH